MSGCDRTGITAQLTTLFLKVEQTKIVQYLIKQESRAVARKQRDTAAVILGLKFADNIH